jgi:hypothetical protein
VKRLLDSGLLIVLCAAVEAVVGGMVAAADGLMLGVCLGAGAGVIMTSAIDKWWRDGPPRRLKERNPRLFASVLDPGQMVRKLTTLAPGTGSARGTSGGGVR